MEAHDIELAQVIWNYHRLPSPLERADLILGLGSYDTRVAEHGARLLAEGWAPRIIFSGAEGNFTRGKWAKSEAEVFADVAMAAGADPECILIEPHATNTGDNIRFSKALCERHELAVESVILISKPNMNRRGYATCQQYWPTLRVTCSAPETHFLHSPAPGHRPEDVVCEMIGDLQRIMEYGRLGFQARQEIPETVAHAYRELIRRGYTNHLLDSSSIPDKVSN